MKSGARIDSSAAGSSSFCSHRCSRLRTSCSAEEPPRASLGKKAVAQVVRKTSATKIRFTMVAPKIRNYFTGTFRRATLLFWFLANPCKSVRDLNDRLSCLLWGGGCYSNPGHNVLSQRVFHFRCCLHFFRAAGGTAGQSQSLFRFALAHDWPVSRGALAHCSRCPWPVGHVLLWRCRRRDLEDHKRRGHLESNL